MTRLWHSLLPALIAAAVVSSLASAQGPGLFGRWRPWGYRWQDPYSYSPYGIYYDQAAQRAEFYLPPIYMPGELAYGPQSVKPFLGVDRNFALGPLLDPPAPPGASAIDAAALKLLIADHLAKREAAKKEDLAAWKAKLPPSGLEARQRATSFLAFGDARFQAQEFHFAQERYRTAMNQAPDLAEPYLRQGFSRLALGQLDNAVDAFRRGLTLDPDWPRREFRLETLYGSDKITRQMHLDALGRTALEKPDDPVPHFLLGILLHWEGHAAVSKRMFDKAISLRPEWRAEAERFK